MSNIEKASENVSPFDKIRDTYHKAIRREKNNQQAQSKRKLMIQKLEAEFIQIPKSSKIHQLYGYSLESNRLAQQLPNILPSIRHYWNKGKQQNYFLLILGNILCDSLTEEEVHEISITVRELIQPSFEDRTFARFCSFFLKMLFKWHRSLGCFQEEDDQIQNEEVFLPIIKVMLLNSQDESVQMNLLKAIRNMFKGAESELDNHYKIKRNIKIIEMISSYHGRIINNQHQQQLLCLQIYQLAVDGYMEPCLFMNNQHIIGIFQRYINLIPQSLFVLQILNGIYKKQGKYPLIDQFTLTFLPSIFNKQEHFWLPFINTLSQNSPHLLAPYLDILLHRVIETCRSSDVNVLEVAFNVLKQLIYCERDGVQGIEFYNTFEKLGGFKVVEEVLTENKVIDEGIGEILNYQIRCLQGMEMDSFNYDI